MGQRPWESCVKPKGQHHVFNGDAFQYQEKLDQKRKLGLDHKAYLKAKRDRHSARYASFTSSQALIVDSSLGRGPTKQTPQPVKRSQWRARETERENVKNHHDENCSRVPGLVSMSSSQHRRISSCNALDHSCCRGGRRPPLMTLCTNSFLLSPSKGLRRLSISHRINPKLYTSAWVFPTGERRAERARERHGTVGRQA